MSKRLWCGIYGVSVVLICLASFAAAIVGMLSSDEILGPGALAAAVAVLALGYLQFVAVHTVTTLILLFGLWKSLEDGVTPVTAGKAIGYLFIPFFNIYWFFRVWGGYPAAYNKFLERHRLNAPQLSGGIFVVFAVTVALTAVLLLPILVLPFVTVFLIARGCDAINNLELARSAAAERRVAAPAEFIGTPENPRSKAPIFALAGAAAVFGVVILGFGAFTWLNLNPKISDDLRPATVANFNLQQPGRVRGSFFGGRLEAMDNFYVTEVGGVRRALRYNLFQYGSEDQASQHFTSLCNSASATVLNDQAGKEAGHFCIDDGAVWLQVGRYFMWAHEPFSYDLEQLKAKEASFDSIVDFVKALPLTKNIVFAGQKSSTTTSTSTTKSTTSSNKSTADFTLTGNEFYDETHSGSASVKAKYKGKTVQITSRVATASADSLMLQAGGYNNIFVYFDGGDAAAIANADRDERVVVKCSAEVEFDIELKHCILVENKGIISPTDAPDMTFTADEYWNSTESTKLPVDAKLKKQNELQGKVLKITGKIKDMAGAKYYMMAGGDEFPCFPDDENQAMFSLLVDGQTASFLAVGGTSLSHCVLAAN